MNLGIALPFGDIGGDGPIVRELLSLPRPKATKV
jgi:hypothetical protein